MPPSGSRKKQLLAVVAILAAVVLLFTPFIQVTRSETVSELETFERPAKYSVISHQALGEVRQAAVYITDFSTGGCDFFTACDPYFVFLVDVDGDRAYDLIKVTETLQDVDSFQQSPWVELGIGVVFEVSWDWDGTEFATSTPWEIQIYDADFDWGELLNTILELLGNELVGMLVNSLTGLPISLIVEVASLTLTDFLSEVTKSGQYIGKIASTQRWPQWFTIDCAGCDALLAMDGVASKEFDPKQGASCELDWRLTQTLEVRNLEAETLQFQIRIQHRQGFRTVQATIAGDSRATLTETSIVPCGSSVWYYEIDPPTVIDQREVQKQLTSTERKSIVELLLGR